MGENKIYLLFLLIESVDLFFKLNFVFERSEMLRSWEKPPSITRVGRKPQLSTIIFPIIVVTATNSGPRSPINIPVGFLKLSSKRIRLLKF